MYTQLLFSQNHSRKIQRDISRNNIGLKMSRALPTCREDVTKLILQQKVVLQRKWKNLATELNQSVEW